MRKTTIEDIKLLWNDMEVRDWAELSQIISSGKEKLDPDEAEELVWAINLLKDEPFPETPQELNEILTSVLFSAPQKVWISYF